MPNCILFGLVSALKELLKHREKSVFLHLKDDTYKSIHTFVTELSIGKNERGEERFYTSSLKGIVEISNVDQINEILLNVTKIEYDGNVIYSDQKERVFFYDYDLELQYYLSFLYEDKDSMLMVGNNIYIDYTNKSFTITKDQFMEDMVYKNIESVIKQINLYKNKNENANYKISMIS